MRTKPDLTEIKTISIVLAIFSVLLTTGFFIGMHFMLSKQHNTTDTAAIGQAGDAVGGLIGTAIAGVTIYLVWLTFRLQKTQLDHTKRELELTRGYLEKQQFESTFFNMLSMINTIGENISVNTGTEPLTNIQNVKLIKGSDFYKLVIKRMQESYYTAPAEGANPIFNYIGKRIHDIEPENVNFPYNHMAYNFNAANALLYDRAHITAWAGENIEQYCGFLYDYWFEEFDTVQAHLFRYIFRTMKFAIQSREKMKDEDWYVGLIQAQLSNYQLAVMFYSGISEVSKNKEGDAQFRLWADKYGLFQNIEPDYLLEKEHCKFYPATRFKCLGNLLPDKYNWNNGEL
jgi:hypothetical protein